jgi:hypothetical protein
LIFMLLAAPFLAVATAHPVHGEIPLLPAEIERFDVIAIERDGLNLFAFDSLTGARSRIELELGETIHFEASRGRIAIVLTDRRALGAASGIEWQELRYGLFESTPELALVEDRVAVSVTDRRALGFLPSGSWIEERFDVRESVSALRVGAAAGVVLTNRRALGVAPNLNRFVEINLQIKEDIESLGARDTLATLRTNRRILVFSGPRAVWTEQDRNLKERP